MEFKNIPHPVYFYALNMNYDSSEEWHIVQTYTELFLNSLGIRTKNIVITKFVRFALGLFNNFATL